MQPGQWVEVQISLPSEAAELTQEGRRALRPAVMWRKTSFGSLEGYLAGRVLCTALAGVKGEVTRAGLPDALRHLGKFDLGLGTELEFGSQSQQACHKVWPTVVRDGRVEPMDWSSLPTLVPARQ